MAKKVFIGVGHGGSDPGAVANGFKEKDLNLSIATACNAELVRHGVTVKMSRTKDENDTLDEEIKECNEFNPDLAIDIHNNAGGGDGAEAFYHFGGGVSKTLAENVLNEVVKIRQNSRGAKVKKWGDVDYYGFIRETKAPAIIIECAFVDNAKDIKVIDTAAEQEKMGIAIAKGILKTLGIAYKKATAAKPATTANTYTVKKGDSLWKIAAEQLGNGTRYKEIKTINALASDTIYAGQVLKLPDKVVSTPVQPVQTAQTIKAGDKVKVLKNIIYGTSNTFAVYYDKYDVIQVTGKRAVIGIGKVVTTAISTDNLIKL